MRMYAVVPLGRKDRRTSPVNSMNERGGLEKRSDAELSRTHLQAGAG